MEWISVEDRLPNQWEEVAVAVYYAGCMNAQNDWLIDEREWKHYAWDFVTHWMHLPEPPINTQQQEG